MSTAAVAPISAKPIATAAGVGVAQIHGDDRPLFLNVHDTSIAPTGRDYTASWEELRKAILGATEAHFSTSDPLVVGPSTTLNGVAYAWPGALVTNGFLKVDGSGNLTWTTSISASLASLTDVALGALSTGQWLFYNGATSKWNNSTATLPTVATLGSILYASAPNVWAQLGPGTAAQFLNMNGGGTAPQWHTLVAADITNAAALTQVSDTNVTLTLGGTPASALLAAASITAGWSGTLAAGRLNANVVQAITNDTNLNGSITAQNLTLAWAGTLAAARLNANVVQSIVNDTNVTGSITAQALTLGWTSTLGVARGGTNLASYTTGDMLYATASTTLAKVGIGAANTMFLSNGTAPGWVANLPYATLPTGNGSWDTGAATTITITRSLTVSGTLTGTLTGGITGSAPAGSLSGTTLAANVVTSSLTTIGTLVAGAVPASLVTSGTFGAGNYIFGGTVSGITTLTATTLAGTLSTASQPNVTTMIGLTAAAALATVGTITAGVWNGTAIVTTYGGTGLASYATGDMLYFNSGTAFNKLGIGAANTVMTSNGSAPVWSTSLTLAGALSATTITASGLMTASASLAVVGGITFTTTVTSTTNAATPSAFVATQSTSFASTTLGNAQMGFGSTWDVSLLNRAGTVVVGVAPNGTGVTLAGALIVAGAVSGVSTLAMTGALSGATSLGYSTQVVSTTALATPGAFVATTSSSFASTVSGNVQMGFGTTNDVTLMNRAGTAVLGVTANTLNVTMAGNLAITGTLTGVTTLTATSIGGTLTTAAQPNVTSVGTLTALTVSGNVAFTGTSGGTLIVGSDPGGSQLVRIGGTLHASGVATLDATAAFTAASPFSMTNGQLVTVALAAQTVGSATLTIPNFANVSDTFAFLALAQTFTNKTLTSPTLGGTVAGTPTWGSNQAITLSTAAQPNVTSVGTLTSLHVSGAVTFDSTGSFGAAATFAASTLNLIGTQKFFFGDNTNNVVYSGSAGGAFIVNNQANSVNILKITDGGVATFGGTASVTMGALTAMTGTFSGAVSMGGAAVNGYPLQVVGSGLGRFTDGTRILDIGTTASGGLLLTQSNHALLLGANTATILTLKGDGTSFFGADPGGSELLRIGGTGHFSGAIGIGQGVQTNVSLGIAQAGSGLSGTSQFGVAIQGSFASGATVAGAGIYTALGTQSSAFTMASGYGILIDAAFKGAGSAITTLYGLFVGNQTVGATNYAIYTNTGPVSLGDSLIFRVAAAQGAYSIAQNATFGLSLSGGTGSSYDLALLNRSQAFAFGVLANTTTVVAGAPGSVQLAIGNAPGGVTSTTFLRKTVGTIANNSATSVLTVTVPNVATGAVLKIRLLGSLGAGGVIGAYESSAAITYDVVLTRTAGLNVVAAISTAYGSTGSASVVGATTMTVTAAVSGISGAAGATNTFTINVTIAHIAGTSTNHNCEVFAELDNAVASGVTMA